MVDEAKPKKRKNSKAKGSGYENTTAKLFSSTFSPLNFRRSQQSGAIVGGKNVKIIDTFSDDMKVLFVGDVVPTNESDCDFTFRFSIECKFYKDADSLDAFLGQKNCKVYAWYQEAVVDAAKLCRLPIVVFKFNHTADYICVGGDVELPHGVDYIKAVQDENNVKIALLKQVLETRDWWLVNKQTGQCMLYGGKNILEDHNKDERAESQSDSPNGA